MANVIKYNTGLVPANAIKSGNFDIGVNFGGYGSTSATNYYNGRTPNVSGYTIYVANGISSPILYAAANDAELIGLSNQLGGSGNTTIGQALTYFRSSSTMTCVNVDYSNIITSGIVLNLDAGFTPSYPRTGTSWSDISGSGTTGTLFNTPVYNSSFYGGIVLDGVDDYIRCSFTALGVNVPWTMSCIFKAGTQLTENGIITLGYLPAIRMLTDNNLNIFWYNGSGYPSITTSGTNYADNQPHNVTATYDGVTVKLYVDSILKGSNVSNVHAIYPNVTLGMEFNNGPKCLNGTIYDGSVYTRALSATEILQNYYAGLQRFIPTAGLVLYLDGNNTNTQVITPTVANDISGNNNPGTLINGVTLARDGQRSFSFDGVDDYINLGDVINNTTGDYSVSMWVKIPSSSSAFTTLFSKKGIAAANAGYAMYYNGSNRKLLWSNGDSTTAQEYYTIAEIPLDQWINVICVRNVGGLIKGYFYINGVEYSITNNPTGLNVSNSYNLTIGKNSTGGLYLIGNVGDVRFYNRVITAAESLTIYNAGRTRYRL
jgi:hypothetical protein